MWVRYLLYECPGKHILCNTRDIKIITKFNRKCMTYEVNVTDKRMKDDKQANDKENDN